jgi:outer membrane immunogenic protein
MVKRMLVAVLLIGLVIPATRSLGQFDPIGYLDGCKSQSEWCRSGDNELNCVLAPCCCYCDWRGSYVGLRAGTAWLDPQVRQPGLPFFPLEHPNSDGFFGGIYAGKNYQYKRLVFGFEGDFNDTGLSEIEKGNPIFDIGFKSDWNASFRGRIGIARHRALFYTTGGYALSQFQGFTQLTPLFPAPTKEVDRERLDGFAVGGGVEYMVSCSTRLRAEFIHEAFGAEVFNYGPLPNKLRPVLDMLSVGVSWKF